MTRAVTLCLFAAALAAAAGPDFVEIPAGSFVMGCEPSGACPDLQPPREVAFERPFLIHATEVTVGDFREFVRASSYRTSAEEDGAQWTWSSPRAFTLADSQPVVSVSLRDARTYWTRDLDCGIALLHAQVGAAKLGVETSVELRVGSALGRLTPASAGTA